MMTKDEFISISRKHGLEIEDDKTNEVVDAYYNKFKYLNNETRFNLIRLARGGHCLSWKYDMEDDRLIHQNHGMDRIYISTPLELENLYTDFDKFIKKAEKDTRLKQIGEL